MRVMIYGGSFNPPHLGHADILRCAAETVHPDTVLVIPAGTPPHKTMPPESPDSQERMELTRLAFSNRKKVLVSDLEMKRTGLSYTVLTVETVASCYPGAEIVLLMGTDMFLSVERWYEHRRLLELCTLAAAPRNPGENAVLEQQAERLKDLYGAKVILIPKVPLPVESTNVRFLLPRRKGKEFLSDEVYSEIIRLRLYGAKPDLDWLREKASAYIKPKRIPHVHGCEQEARKLAERWGEDPDTAAEAGILHDITKKMDADEQLRYSEKNAIVLTDEERAAPNTLHAVTGAYFSREHFGVPDNIFNAIRWHTTGCPGMTRLDMIIYLADFIEPTRSFEGLDELRSLAYEDLEKAMAHALEMSLANLAERGIVPHSSTTAALKWLRSKE